MAGLLARAFWPRLQTLGERVVPLAALTLEFLWMGLAMSGPIVLLLDRRGPSTGEGPDTRDRKPARPGKLMGAVPVDPVGRGPARRVEPAEPRYTRAEMAWLGIGGYCIALTLVVAPTRSLDVPWVLSGLLQGLTAVALLVFSPRKARSATGSGSWTHPAAVGLLATWPLAWLLLILLSREL